MPTPVATSQLDGIIKFELKQFHFHAPSENHIDGKSFPMEAHLSMPIRRGNLVVVAVMFRAGRSQCRAGTTLETYAGTPGRTASADSGWRGQSI